jgi:hypothetical protein
VDAFRNRQVQQSLVETGDTRPGVHDCRTRSDKHVVVRADLTGHLPRTASTWACFSHSRNVFRLMPSCSPTLIRAAVTLSCASGSSTNPRPGEPNDPEAPPDTSSVLT